MRENRFAGKRLDVERVAVEFLVCKQLCTNRRFLYVFQVYRVVGNWWYKRKGGDSTRKKKSKIWNKNFSFEALFSRKSILNFRSVRVHFIASRYNGSHCRSFILSYFHTTFHFHTLKRSNTLESVHRNLIRRVVVCVRQNGQHFQQIL